MIECVEHVPKKRTSERIGLHDYQLVCSPNLAAPSKGKIYAVVVTRNRNLRPCEGYFADEDEAFRHFHDVWLPELRVQEF